MMSDQRRYVINDATAPQPRGVIRFPWSGFCKDGIVRRYAFVLTHAYGKQWARKTIIPRPGNTSRRITWRNSLLYQRFWCPSSQQPVLENPQSLPLNRSQLRSMSSRCRPKASITDQTQGQSPCSAPPFQTTRSCVQSSERNEKLLWRWFHASDSLAHGHDDISRVKPSPKLMALPMLAVLSVNRSVTCRKSLLCWPSVQLSRFRPVPARHPRQSLYTLPRSWWSQRPAKANIVEFLTGQAPAPDPRFGLPALAARRQSC